MISNKYWHLILLQIEEDGEATYGAWEDCAEGCPGMPTTSRTTSSTTKESTTGITETATPGHAGHSCSMFDHRVLFLICFNIFVVKLQSN